MIIIFKDYLLDILKTVNENVEGGTNRPKDNGYPSITFTLPTSSMTDVREDFIFEINIWDNISDTDRIDTITDQIDEKFKTCRYIDDKQLLIFQKLNRLEIADEKEYIKRRLLRYLVKKYER